MEQTCRNSFFSPVNRVPGEDYSNDLIEVWELKDFVEKGPSGDPSDFVVYKKEVKVDSYHMRKVLNERAKGCDLKSIISRIQQTGDTSLLNQREVVYGDGFETPSNLSDALQKGIETEAFLDSLSDEEIKKRIDLSHMSQEQFDSYIKSIVDEKLKASGDSKVKEGDNK